ncbi:MAG: hypothetical protein ACTSRZ_08665 [Promethearchaeota archaeon]
MLENRRGEVPGAVPNGIARPPLKKEIISQFPDEISAYNYTEDLPYIDFSISNPNQFDLGDFRTNEVCILNNANFLIAFSFLKAILLQL